MNGVGCSRCGWRYCEWDNGDDICEGRAYPSLMERRAEYYARPWFIRLFKTKPPTTIKLVKGWRNMSVAEQRAAAATDATGE